MHTLVEYGYELVLVVVCISTIKTGHEPARAVAQSQCTVRL